MEARVKNRAEEKLARRKENIRERGERILIVTEGAESAVDIFLNGKKGKGNERIEPKAYDIVYIVFDRDSHLYYIDALDKVEGLKNKHKNDEKKIVQFIAIPSNPCVEYWFLLHFKNQQALIHRDAIQKELKIYIKNYDKADESTFNQTKHLLKIAIKNAERINSTSCPRSDETPHTSIPILIKALISSERLDRLCP